MILRPKHLPRLWCAMQGLLPLEACVAARRVERAQLRQLLAPETTTPLPADGSSLRGPAVSRNRCVVVRFSPPIA